MDLLEYIEGTRRTRSSKGVQPLLDTIERALSPTYAHFDELTQDVMNQNAAANAAFGLIAEVYEFIEISDSQPPFRLNDEKELVDELGDVYFYAATLIDVLPMQLSIEERVDMFFFYYDIEIIPELKMSFSHHLQNICSMGKKIVAHGIDPNAEYKNSGVSFNQIFMRNLADLLKGLMEEINSCLRTENEYSLSEIWTQNMDKLKLRHPTGFDENYNYVKDVFPEPVYLPCISVDSLSPDTGDITRY